MGGAASTMVIFFAIGAGSEPGAQAAPPPAAYVQAGRALEQPGQASQVRLVPAGVPLSGAYPVAFVLCNFQNWHAEPNNLAYYQDLWTRQSPPGIFSSLADYFHDVSFGQMRLAGSQVLGWFSMGVNPETWYEGGNGYRESKRWLDCINAALAKAANLEGYRAWVAVTPYVQGKITGKGLAAEPALKPGQKAPAPETMTVDSTAGWPSAPFLMSLPDTKAFPFGENVLVSKVSGDTLTLTRGFNEGVSQLKGPFAGLPPGGTVVPDTDDDFAYVGPQTVYMQEGAQLCTGLADTFCPKVFLSPPGGAIGYQTLKVGVANLFAGDDRHDGNVNAGVGDSAHEVGHTTGYDHSRVLSNSTNDYNDCYDQMSYNACGLPGFRGEAGPPDGVLGYDAIDLEFHGWVPARAIYSAPSQGPARQVTMRLHALSDPDALKHLQSANPANGQLGTYLDVHIPARVTIEDVSPGNVSPTIPPTCSGSGYHCATSQYYTVEYRQVYGFDQSLRAESVTQPYGPVPVPVGAVTLHLFAPDPGNPDGNISYLVDSYPGQKTGKGGPVFLPNGGALQPGNDFADTVHNTYVAINSFDKSSMTATITVGNAKLKPQILYTGDGSGGTGRNLDLSATLTVDGAPVPGQPVSIDVGGQTCPVGFTDASGVASCNITNTLSAGNWPVTISFAGDQAYQPAKATGTFAVWAPATLEPDALTKYGPALTTYKGALYAAWTNEGDGQVDFSSYNGATWSSAAPVSGPWGTASTDNPPALVAARGDLYAFWTGQADDEIHYSAYDGTNWSAAGVVSGPWGTALTGFGPAVTVDQTTSGPPPLLWVAWTGKDTSQVFYSSYNGTSWASQTDVGSESKTPFGPALTEDFDSNVYVAWTTAAGKIDWKILGFPAVTYSVPEALTNAAPALGWTGGSNIWFAWKGRTTGKLGYLDYNGSVYSTQLFEPDALTDRRPALANLGSTLCAAWKGKETDEVADACLP
jgi:hypothetical protein